MVEGAEIKESPAEGPSTAALEPTPTGSEINESPPVKALLQSGHVLTSTKRGESTIEKLAKKMETRRENRIPVTFEIRKEFLNRCQKIALEEGFKSKFSFPKLVKMRDELKAKVEDEANMLKSNTRYLQKAFGFWDKDAVLLSLYERGVANGEAVGANWFFFRDFNFYHTVIAPKFGIFGKTALGTLTSLLLFYLGSAVFFCVIIDDDQICPCRDGDLSRKDFRGTDDCPRYEGWLTTVYFASVTMSTVGYGDINISGQENWRIFIGVLYMLVALLVGYTVFATAADYAIGGLSGSGTVTSCLFRSCVENYDPTNTPLYLQVRRVTILRIVELVIYFLTLNFVGMVIARPFINNSDEDGEDWNWMTTFYWAVQTTTTIGYGDLNMPFDMRWFQIFFTTLGTAFVGGVFGGIASLKSDVQDLRRFYAWKRREISKHLIEDMEEGPNSDQVIDQYEFLVGSLLMLNKIESSDVEQIMDKFRELAGTKGYIMYEDAKEDAEKKAGEAMRGGNENEGEMEDIDAEETRF